jgi:hypothetical protein
MDHNIGKLLGKPTLEGQVGESHVWDGPLDTTGVFQWVAVVAQVLQVCRLVNILASRAVGQ